MTTVARAVEARAEVESLESLQQQRRNLVRRAKSARAQSKTFDARRKQRRSAIAALIIADTKEKLSEAAIERMSSGDERYKAYLDECELAFAELELLEDEILAITERISSRQTELNTYNAELRLAR
jgi:hypothetical protein